MNGINSPMGLGWADYRCPILDGEATQWCLAVSSGERKNMCLAITNNKE